MEYSFDERCENIIAACLQEKSANQDYIRIHGPEHHILDGAALLTAFYNAGGED